VLPLAQSQAACGRQAKVTCSQYYYSRDSVLHPPLLLRCPLQVYSKEPGNISPRMAEMRADLGNGESLAGRQPPASLAMHDADGAAPTGPAVAQCAAACLGGIARPAGCGFHWTCTPALAEKQPASLRATTGWCVAVQLGPGKTLVLVMEGCGSVPRGTIVNTPPPPWCLLLLLHSCH